MFTSLFFQICSLFYIVLLTIVYFSKKRLNTLENKVYVAMIITNIVGLILDMTTVYMGLSGIQSQLLTVLCKLYLVYLATWSFLLTYYIIVISFKKDEPIKDNNQKQKKKLNISIMLYQIFIIFSIILLFLPLYVYSENGIMYTHGPSVIFNYFINGFAILVMLGCLTINYKNIRNKKYYPLYFFILIGAIAMAIQIKYPDLLLVTSMETFITFLMYFTIENPDLQMIEQLNIARDQAEKANRAKTEFLSNMSHEIRTPLNAVVGFSQSLSEQEISDNIKEDVKDIITASNSLLEIVNGILDISKIEANKLEIVNTKYSIKKVLDELVSLTKGRLGDKPIEFRVKFDENLPSVLYGDYIRLKQIILNILTNSVKYTDRGFIEFKVNSVVKDDICHLIFSIEDSGVGIKPEKIDRLFNKFERMNEEGHISIEGTGLGLAITKKLVDLMNGKIVAQSVYGQGSKFTVLIKQKLVESTTEEELQKTKEINASDINCDGKRILIVDDNNINIKVAIRLLSSYNVITDSVTSGQDCIDKILIGEQYDLILLDDMMPKMTGVEVFKALKQIAGFDTPVVALTANAISGMKEKYLQEGFNDYLAKPIEKNELSRVIKNFLDKNQ